MRVCTCSQPPSRGERGSTQLDNHHHQTTTPPPPGCVDEDLPEGSRVELPLWLARALEAKNMVRLEYPKHYAARFREDLLAGPEAVDIRDRSNFFYEVCVCGMVW